MTVPNELKKAVCNRIYDALIAIEAIYTAFELSGEYAWQAGDDAFMEVIEAKKHLQEAFKKLGYHYGK